MARRNEANILQFTLWSYAIMPWNVDIDRKVAVNAALQGCA
jgi:hypothetical protein